MPGSDRVRLDKWLWAARFFKTRTLAAEAVAGGKVHVGGERAKPARAVKPGDQIAVQRGFERTVVLVLALSERRGPAPEAAKLYAETEASRAERERRRAEAAAQPVFDAGGRPTKRDRRRFQDVFGEE